MARSTPLTDVEKTQLHAALTNAKKNKQPMSSVESVNPRFTPDVIKYWNKKWDIFKPIPQKVYTDEQIKAVVDFANEHGPSAAARKFDIPKQTIINWRKKELSESEETSDGAENNNSSKEYTVEEKKRLLRKAQKFNKDTNSFGGMSHVILEDKVGRGNLYKWNEEYKIVKTKPTFRPKKIGYDEAKEVIEILELNNGVISKTARQVGLTADTIKNIKENLDDYRK